MAENKPKKPKFKYTRELVRIAIEDGMTQKEIADICRVSQSMVSGWLKGDSRAYEHQMVELKRRYSHRLNRTTSRVYLATTEEKSGARWEDSELARRLLALSKEVREDGYSDENRDEWAKLQEEILPYELKDVSLEALSLIAKEEFEAAQRTEQIMKVEGPIVLRHTFVQPTPIRRGRTLELTRTPVARWLVHHQPNGRFVLIRQARRVLVGRARWQWLNALNAANEASERIFGAFLFSRRELKHQQDEVPYVECADDAARWLSFIHGPMEAHALLEFCDAYIRDPKALHGPHDELALPFLVRKMLVEHGHEVPGVVHILATE